MPNQPATTIRGIRIPDDLWEEAKAIAHDEGFASASEMVRDCLERRVAEHRRKHAQSGET
jgi:metal-responsive CopG/Arc/MetJ family transcriptional regulator